MCCCRVTNVVLIPASPMLGLSPCTSCYLLKMLHTHWGCEALSQQFTCQPVMDDSHDFRPTGALLYMTKIAIVPLLTYPVSVRNQRQHSPAKVTFYSAGPGKTEITHKASGAWLTVLKTKTSFSVYLCTIVGTMEAFSQDRVIVPRILHF